MKCPQCQTDNPAGARFCLKCGASLVMHCSNCRTELPAGSRFCTSCGQPVRTGTAADEARFSRLAAAAPERLIQKARAAANLAGERRVVTVLFADVVGSTALAERLGVDDWTEMMNGVLDRITVVVYRYEGTIARLLGDGLWAFFGAPLAHEDDPIRAVRVALDVLAIAAQCAQEIRRRHGIEFQMRVCLHTGPVVVGPVGDGLRYEHTAMGDTVNLAARLKFAAQPMTALITDSTYRSVGPVFECIARGLVETKDRTEPVQVYEVSAAKLEPVSARGLAVAGLRSPMVGRDAELASLVRLSDAVQAGLGRAVLIVGEPGLGKTRLIAEWKAAVDARQVALGPCWIEGRCLSYGQGLPYHLLGHLLRSILGVPETAEEPETRAGLRGLTEDLFGDSAVKVYPCLGHLLMLKLEGEALERMQMLDPQGLQAQYLWALRRLIGALASRRPLALILEDVHWADPSSTELLIRLLPLAATAPVLFCMTTRPDRDAPGWRLVTAAREALGGSLTEIVLGALSEADSRRLVANLLEIEALPQVARSLILKKAEGNPLFVEEVIRMFIEQGAIVRRNGGWVAAREFASIDIPDNLQGLLMARIDRLPEEVKHTLRVAAVIGRQFPVKVLARVLQEDSTP